MDIVPNAQIRDMRTDEGKERIFRLFSHIEKIAKRVMWKIVWVAGQ